MVCNHLDTSLLNSLAQSIFSLVADDNEQECPLRPRYARLKITVPLPLGMYYSQINKFSNMQKQIFAAFIAFGLGSLYCTSSAKETAPLKVIAPDLIVESVDFGKFPPGHGPLDDGMKPNEYRFIPLSKHLANQKAFGYGYRIRLKTDREKVRIFQGVDAPFNLGKLTPKKGDGTYEKPVNGAIYKEFLMDGLKNGNYNVYLWVEDVELPKLEYTVKF